MKHSVREIKLKNGAKGLLINVPGANVMTYEFSFRAGEFLCEEDKCQTAHLMEHLALGANKKYHNSNKFLAIIEQNGASTNASTGVYNINYTAECAEFEWDRIMDLMLLAISQPLFLEKEFDSEFGNVREELMTRANNHDSMLNRESNKYYGLCGKTIIDGLDSLQNITLDDVRQHYHKTHFARNMRFVIAGNIDSEKSKKLIRKLEAIELPVGDMDRIELPDEIPKPPKEALYMPSSTVKNLYFTFDVFHNQPLTEPEQDSAFAVDIVFTGTWNSRIMGKAREDGLLYYIDSGTYNSKNFSSWWISSQVSSEKIGDVFDLIVKESRRVLDGKLSLTELKAAKQFALGRYQIGTQTVSGLAGGYTGWYFREDRINDYDAYPDRVKAITRARAIASYQKLFEEEIWGLGFLGTADKSLREELAAKISRIWR